MKTKYKVEVGDREKEDSVVPPRDPINSTPEREDSFCTSTPIYSMFFPKLSLSQSKQS